MTSTDALTKLYIEITTSCNLDCQMCIQRVWHESLGGMSRQTFTNLMADLSRLPSPPTIHLSGYGEPMTHPDFLEMVRQAKALGSRVEVTTNGTLLNEEMAEALVDLNLDSLTVSIDGVDPDLYADIRVKGSLGQVIANLRTLRRIKLRRRGRRGQPDVGIAFVAMKRNVADLPKLPHLATHLGANRIIVSNLVPHLAEMEREILYAKALKNCAFRASRWVPELSLPKFDLNGETLAPLRDAFASTASLSLLDVSMSARNDYCRFAQEGYAALRWDGEVSPCLPLLHSHPVYVHGRRKQVTHHSFGNINERPFVEIWESPEFSAFRDKLRRFYFSPCTTCGGCERFGANYEDCTGNTFPTCGGCLWSQGFVQCP